ncbi:hypothetical protein GCM10020369_37940 [Cryptosporangium minutisporangium]|uniref:Uncharacterized protein n=1 Tax=Cryptosporangium minutisporangium TaxID=113569 RepID=A0ABP6T123_9ACTN
MRRPAAGADGSRDDRRLMNPRAGTRFQRDLEVSYLAVLDVTADLADFEPFEVPHGLVGSADRHSDRVVHAGSATADDLAEPIHVLAHGAPHADFGNARVAVLII